MSDFVLLHGERYLRLAVVAQWYDVEVAFLEEAVELELLEVERADDREVVVAEQALDRLAELLRWSWQTGLGLEALAVILPARPRREGR
jgi:hypothetical protein